MRILIACSLAHPMQAHRMGQRGREVAVQHFAQRPIWPLSSILYEQLQHKRERREVLPV